MLIIGSHSQCVVAIDASTGEVLWLCRLQGRVESTAAVYARGLLVIVGCYDGNVYALSLRTGEIMGSFRTGGEVKASASIDEENGNAWVTCSLPFRD